jgi:hypothetical protein
MDPPLDKIFPWGRSFDEYVRMFGLGPVELSGRILGCADGPASFNAELHARGGQIVSVDPLYALSVELIRQRIRDAYPEVLAATRANRDAFVWTHIRSIEELGDLRMAAMERFLADYPLGLREGRYRAESLPKLSLETGSFDLALCSHFLFTYSDILSEPVHVGSLREMCRIATEARVFPLVTRDGQRSPHLDGVRRQLVQSGYTVEIRRVGYEFQRGGNETLVVTTRNETRGV